MERGRYLVENVGGCGECHTPRTTTYGLDMENAYTGEKGLTGAVAPDISKARMAGLATPDVFTLGLIDDGKKLSGAPLTDPVMREIAHGLSVLNEKDRTAIYAFLSDREVKPPQPVAQSATAVCTESTPASALGGGNAGLPARPMPSSANIAAIAMAPAKARKDPIRPVTSARSQPTPLSWFPAMPPNPVCLPR